MKEGTFKQLEYPGMTFRKVFGLIYSLILFLLFLQALAAGIDLLRFILYIISFGGLLGFFLFLEYKTKHKDYFLHVEQDKLIIERAVFPTLTVYYKYIVDMELVGKKDSMQTRYIHFRYQTDKDDFATTRKLFEVYGFDVEEFYFALKQHVNQKED